MEKVKKGNKEKIMEMIRKAGDSDNYETSWNEKGIPYKIKKKSKIKEGKLSRAQGARFELKVRNYLEEQGFVIDKWSNNVDLEKDKLAPAKRKYNPFKKMLVVGTGFPDFISIKKLSEGLYNVIGVEVKMNGILSKIEKEKCAWYLKKGIFSEIWVAKKGKKRGGIECIDFARKHNKL